MNGDSFPDYVGKQVIAFGRPVYVVTAGRRERGGGWWELHGWTPDGPGRQMAAWGSSEEKDIGLVARGLSQGALLGVGPLYSVYDVSGV